MGKKFKSQNSEFISTLIRIWLNLYKIGAKKHKYFWEDLKTEGAKLRSETITMFYIKIYEIER